MLRQKRPDYLLLREKELSHDALADAAVQIGALCRAADVRLVVNGDIQAALAADAWGVQLPFPTLASLRRDEIAQIRTRLTLGASVHSLDDAVQAQQVGCDFLIAGHVFDTSCKPGFPARGLDFFRGVCDAVTVPVWAIGGITPDNAEKAYKAGAACVCMMSYYYHL